MSVTDPPRRQGKYVEATCRNKNPEQLKNKYRGVYSSWTPTKICGGFLIDKSGDVLGLDNFVWGSSPGKSASGNPRE